MAGLPHSPRWCAFSLSAFRSADVGALPLGRDPIEWIVWLSWFPVACCLSPKGNMMRVEAVGNGGGWLGHRSPHDVAFHVFKFNVAGYTTSSM
jgi:hypothetical protein